VDATELNFELLAGPALSVKSQAFAHDLSIPLAARKKGPMISIA
jgi:hypothetical protein